MRFAAELGYDSAIVKDGTADSSDAEMRAALEVNLQNYANAIVPTSELVDAISVLMPRHLQTRQFRFADCSKQWDRCGARS